MKKYKKKSFNLTLYFTFVVFFASLGTGFLSGGIAFLLFRSNFMTFRPLGPIVMLGIVFGSSAIFGASIAALTRKRSVHYVHQILKAVDEIGKGNFDVRLNEDLAAVNLLEVAKNINIMAKELKNLEIMRQDFVQNFSHEFKTPIVSIQGFAKRLLTKNLTKEESDEYISIILEECSRLAGLAENTLLMGKLESLERSPQKKLFLLDEQIRQCVLILEKQWSKKGIEVDLEIPPLPYHGCEEMLKQVWLNLISNSIKFTQENGKITICAKVNNGAISVCVIDTGIGMDEATLSRIFDKFYQSDPSRATDGNGLGLPIVKKILDIVGGEILVKSEPALGSTFTVNLS